VFENRVLRKIFGPKRDDMDIYKLNSVAVVRKRTIPPGINQILIFRQRYVTGPIYLL
jgi:hypothetical protein